MKQTLRKEFNDVVKDINLDTGQIALMSQKTLDRIKVLKAQQLDRQNTSSARKLTSHRSLGTFSRQMTTQSRKNNLKD